MSLSAEEIGRVVEILRRDLTRAIMRKVISPSSPDRIALELRSPGTNHILEIVTSPGVTRLGRLHKKPRAADSPHPFVMLLRGELGGMVLGDVSQINGDRVVRFDFAAHERKGSIVCELTSRHANLFWLDASGQIAGSFYPNRSHKRKLVPGEHYTPPLPHPNTKNATDTRFTDEDNLEAQIEKHYSDWEAKQLFEREAARTRRLATKAARRQDKLLARLDADRARAAKGDSLTNLGHLLKANLHLAKKGVANLRVIDFEGNEMTIPLDPRLGPVENMERLFSKSKRLRRAVPKIDERQSKIRADRDWIKALVDEIETAGLDRLFEMREQIVGRFPNLKDQGSGRRNTQPERLPYREHSIATGRTARVGRSARDNDALTLRFARPDDLWLHVRGRPGSHVVVPLGRGEDPTSEMLIDAAHLAVHFSEARGDDDVEVVHTRRRYVQKPRGAPPGSVRLIKEKTIFLRLEQDRLARLLNR
ncbi:MAG: DUF814 domain-containing protein [Deltaproteobacteria bacterium]|nr:DUF814 domain-containing protein [Deltaproteobacteria bacterium]